MALEVPQNSSKNVTAILNQKMGPIDISASTEAARKQAEPKSTVFSRVINKPKYDKLQENPPTRQPKGLEKIISVVGQFVIRAQASTVQLLWGRYEIQSDPKKTKIQKAFDRGIIYVLSKIASIDFCKIISASLNSINIGPIFDPLNPPLENASQFEKTKWQIQYRAFQIQKLIDNFYGTFGTEVGQDTRVGLKELIIELNQNLRELKSPNVGLTNPDITKNFPQVSIVLNTVDTSIAKFSSYLNVRNISQTDIQNIIKFIDDTKKVAVAIQQLNTPANLISVADKLTGGGLNDEINKLEEFIGSRGEPVKFIKYLIQQANKLNSTGKAILGYITLLRTLIKLVLFLLKIFYTIRFWITGNPIPAAFTPLGAIQTLETAKEEVIDRRGIANFLARLQQFDILIREIASLAEILVVASVEMINKLTMIKMNMESCNPKLAQEIQDTIEETANNADKLDNFLRELNSTIQKADSTFGAYTIEILTEQLVDEGIRLKRRYGVAKDSNGYVVVQSTPTFASWDQIIINEVKFLLASKGLVKSSVPSISPEETVIYENAVSLLGEDSVDFNLNELSSYDPEVLDSQQDISTFFNNLPGGSAFRRQSRARIIKNNEKLIKELKKTDPNSQYTKSAIKEKQDETNKLKIEKLEDEKSALKAAMVAAATNPVTAVGIPKIAKRIQEIDKEIFNLKSS